MTVDVNDVCRICLERPPRKGRRVCNRCASRKRRNQPLPTPRKLDAAIDRMIRAARAGVPLNRVADYAGVPRSVVLGAMRAVEASGEDTVVDAEYQLGMRLKAEYGNAVVDGAEFILGLRPRRHTESARIINDFLRRQEENGAWELPQSEFADVKGWNYYAEQQALETEAKEEEAKRRGMIDGILKGDVESDS